MAYINKYDKDGECSKVGHTSEYNFVMLAISRGWDVESASKSENMFKHIDFNLVKKDEDSCLSMAVDVKSRKKTSRKDTKFNDDWIWLEFKNVRGDKGWLMGNATHIVFEREKEFTLVSREGLLGWAEQVIADRNGGKVSVKCKAKNARDAKYKYYTRWNRSDVLTQVNYQDMIKGVKNVEIWRKNP